MEIIDVTKYWPVVNEDFKDNVLIRCLPPLSKSMIKEILTSPVVYCDSERDESADLRIQYLNRLLRFIYPTEAQVDFAYSLYSLIMQAYTAVNPESRDSQRRFNEMCEALATNTYMGTDDLALFRSPLCVTLIGTPGCGKSRIVELLLDRLSVSGDILRHPKYGGIFQKLHVVIQTPKVRQHKSLAWLVYDELYAVYVRTGGTRAPLKYQSTSGPAIAREAAVLARLLNLGVLVIEEIQHAVHLSKGFDQESMEFLTTLVNAVRMPVLLIGTWKAVALFRSEMRLARRSCTPASTNFCRFQPGKEWNDLVAQVLVYQYVRNPIEFSQPIADLLYKLTQGIPDVLVKLLVLTQLEAIRTGAEAIDAGLLQKCADRHLTHLYPSVAYLRTGVKEWDEQLWDVEPKDFDEYYARLEAECTVAVRGRGGSAADALTATIKAARVANLLVAAGAASEDTAGIMASQAIKENPSASVAVVTKKVLERTTRKAPQPAPNPKKIDQLDQEFEQMRPDDVRRIIYKAKRAKSDCQDALASAGHLRPVNEVLPL